MLFLELVPLKETLQSSGIRASVVSYATEGIRMAMMVLSV